MHDTVATLPDPLEGADAWLFPLGISTHQVRLLEPDALETIIHHNRSWATLGLNQGNMLIPRSGEVIYGQRVNVSYHQVRYYTQWQRTDVAIEVLPKVFVDSGSSQPVGTIRRLEQQDVGSLYLTTRRAHFIGRDYSFEYCFAQLGVYPKWYTDGYITLSRGEYEDWYWVGSKRNAEAWCDFISCLIYLEQLRTRGEWQPRELFNEDLKEWSDPEAEDWHSASLQTTWEPKCPKCHTRYSRGPITCSKCKKTGPRDTDRCSHCKRQFGPLQMKCPKCGTVFPLAPLTEAPSKYPATANHSTQGDSKVVGGVSGTLKRIFLGLAILCLALFAMTSVFGGNKAPDKTETPVAMLSETQSVATPTPLLPTPTLVSATSTPIVSPMPVIRVIAANGEGVNLRPTPGAKAALTVIPDGVHVTVLGPTEKRSGQEWAHVRLPSGQQGWVASAYLATIPTATAMPSASVTLTPSPSPTLSTRVTP